MLIPQGTTPSADRRTWQLPSGTVWLEARFFVAEVQNLIGVRITSGTLTFKSDLVPRPGIFLSPGTLWELSLDLEQPPHAGGASDAEALHLQIPTQMQVGTNIAPAATFTGDLALSGFGSDLHFTFSGAAPSSTATRSDFLCKPRNLPGP